MTTPDSAPARVSVFDGVQSIKPSRKCELPEIIRDISSEKWKQPVETIREAYRLNDEGRAKQLKAKLPAITASGIFSVRNASGLSTYSKIICIDIDDLDEARAEELRTQAKSDKHAYAGFISPSGTGCKIFYRVVTNAEQHKIAYDNTIRYVETGYNVQIDKSGKDICRLCFVSHDPGAFCNPSAALLHFDATPKQIEIRDKDAAQCKPEYSIEEVSRALKSIPPRPPYEAWMRIIAAVKDAVGRENALSLLKEWSPPETPGEYEEKIDQYSKVHADALFFAARKHGWLPLDELLGDANPWPAPVPFGRIEPPALDLAEAIPATLAPFRNFILATAEAVQISPDAVAPLAMAIVSLAASRAFEVQLLLQWSETAPLWIVVLAEPGERKSALLSAIIGPLHSWQGDERSRLKCALAKYAEARRIAEARLAGLRSKIAKAKQGDVLIFSHEAEDLAARLENMPPLATPDLVTSDATPEAVRELLVRNGEKLGLVSAETDAGQLMGSRYAKSGGANVDLFLASFTGDACPAHRVGRDLPLARPSLAMALAVQPAAMREVLGDTIARGRGFVDRMALIQPTSRMGSRSLTPPPVPKSHTQWWDDTLRRILNCPWPGRVFLDGESPSRCEQPARVLTLSPAAHDAFCALRAELEPQLKDGGELRPISGFASKLPGVVARLALAFQLMEDTNAPAISADAMQAACAWAPFLIGHFRAVLGAASERQEIRHARRLVDALRRQGDCEITARDCFRLIDGADVPSMEDCGPVLAELIAMHYLRALPETDKGKGRPGSPRFSINPAVFSAKPCPPGQ